LNVEAYHNVKIGCLNLSTAAFNCFAWTVKNGTISCRVPPNILHSWNISKSTSHFLTKPGHKV